MLCCGGFVRESFGKIQMNTCGKCNSPVPEEKAFCPNCGAAMMPERERAVEYVSEEMLPTMYDQEPPAKKISVADLEPNPVKAETGAAAQPPAPNAAPHKPSAKTYNLANAAPKDAAAADGNRTLYSILIAAAALFTLSIIVVAILYVTGKI